jgi:glycosyltransferase involved in cell wall biosynthesis
LAKRILIFTNHFYPEQFKINEIVDWLSVEKSHIRVVTGLPNYPQGKIYKDYINNSIKNFFSGNVIINRLFLIPRGNGSILMLLINYISYFVSCSLFTIYIAIFKKKYDIIFVHHTSPILIAIHPIIYSIFYRSKKILWDLDIWPESLKAVNVIKSKLILKIIKWLVKLIYSKYNLILVGSKSLKEIVSNRYHGEVLYFPNWADKVIENNKIDNNIKFNISREKFNIMYTGNIGRAQNFEELVKTIQLVQDNVHWVFVGDGRFKKEFKSLLKQKKIIHKTTFIGNIDVDKMSSIATYANSLFLSLKDDEIFSKTVPAKLQTYMALGKPIIGVLKGDGATIIKDSRCGIVEENYNYVGLAAKINSFTNKQESEYFELGRNGKIFYENNFKSKLRKQDILKIIYE